jgi:hypothetical protein
MPAVSLPPTRGAYSSPRTHVRSALSRPPLPAPPRPARPPGTSQSAPSASTFRKPHSSTSAGASPPPGGPTAKKPRSGHYASRAGVCGTHNMRTRAGRGRARDAPVCRLIPKYRRYHRPMDSPQRLSDLCARAVYRHPSARKPRGKHADQLRIKHRAGDGRLFRQRRDLCQLTGGAVGRRRGLDQFGCTQRRFLGKEPTMTQPEKVPYTSQIHPTGGRDGASSSLGGHPDTKLSTPGSAHQHQSRAVLRCRLVGLLRRGDGDRSPQEEEHPPSGPVYRRRSGFVHNGRRLLPPGSTERQLAGSGPRSRPGPGQRSAPDLPALQSHPRRHRRCDSPGLT